ncbi:metallophosphoesterase [Sorangium sp. So ce1182]|uniref:metallophosphoesterase n=1 Tax=Sorangium sp. So ce1182 TaxID=3133334 RepID=UPI003F603465
MNTVNEQYNWTRFWCRRDGQIVLGEGGYLLDPEGEYGRRLNPDVVPFDHLAGMPCLVLLGEPGIGKSTAMARQITELRAQLAQGEALLAVDFRCEPDPDKALFSKPKFQSWLDGSVVLHLFIDSLDECPDPRVAARLLGQLSEGPRKKLRLRLACRTAELPQAIETQFPTLWKYPNELGFYELAPLRRKDITAAAGPDAAGFLAEIERQQVEALAIKPITLGLLLNLYRRHRALPARRNELYLDGCRLLCEEASWSRRDTKLIGRLTTQQRLAVAARIAAVFVFGRRVMIWRGIDQGDVPEDAILEHLLCGKTEQTNGESFEVTAESVRETLELAGLFTSRGPNRLGWSHQTYAEFLAAQFVVQRGLQGEALARLLMHPDSPKVAPQLRETAAWLASRSIDVFRCILENDPEVLLRSDVAMADDDDRERLVRALLERFDRREAIDRYLDLQAHGKKLAHPGLPSQLAAYIQDQRRHFMARRAAIDLAEACKLTSLQGLLADIALDLKEPYNVRVQAAHAVVVLGDEDTLVRLRPLALGMSGDDPDDELKGQALGALGTRLLTTVDLFACLTPPKNEHILGSYSSFLHQPIDKDIAITDLPVALAWVERQATDGSQIWLAELDDRILRRAWEHLEVPSVLLAFVHVVRIRLDSHGAVFQKQSQGDVQYSPLEGAEKRRKVVDALLSATPEMKYEFGALRLNGLISANDVVWAVGRLEQVADPSVRRRWSRVIAGLLSCSEDAAAIDAVLNVAERVDELKESLGPYSVDIDSQQAEALRKDWHEMESWERKRAARQHVTLHLDVRFRKFLDRFEQGELDAWWKLHRELTLKPTSTHYGNEMHPDLTTFPGWQHADEEIRGSILKAAKQYLLCRDAAAERWIGSDEIHRPAAAGYRGLRLVAKLDPNWLTALPKAAWRRWAPIIIGYPMGASREGADADDQHLVALAYENASEEFLWSLAILIDRESRHFEYISITSKLTPCWDERLGSLLLAKATDVSLNPRFFGSLLGELIRRKVRGAREYAISFLVIPIPADAPARARVEAAAHAIFLYAEDAGRPLLLKAIHDDAAFGREVLLKAASRADEAVRHESGWARRFSEEEAAELYLWMEREFPSVEDPIEMFEGGTHAVTDRERVADFRRGLLDELASRGTRASLAAVERIANALSDRDNFFWVVLRAREATLHGTWAPLQPEHIIGLMPQQHIPHVTQDPVESGSPVPVSSGFAPLFSWIQLSDIHVGHGGAAHRWDQQLVFRALCRDIGVALDEGCPVPDVLLVTGDVAFSATEEQYATASVWLSDAARAARLDPSRVFLLPGNHDIDWGVDVDRNVSRLLRSLHQGVEELDTALAHAGDRAHLIRRLERYLSFSRRFAPACLVPDDGHPAEQLFGWSHHADARGGLGVRMLGLNTALLSAEGDDRGRLRLGRNALAKGLGSVQEGELVIVLSHHPLQGGWLIDERYARGWLQNHAHVHLSGHVHDAESEETRSGGGGQFVRVTAGAVHGERQPEGVPAGHGYNFAAVVRCAGTDELVLRVWPRRFSDKNTDFRPDVDNLPPRCLYAEHRLRLRLK